jgi:hypothetical protein
MDLPIMNLDCLCSDDLVVSTITMCSLRPCYCDNSAKRLKNMYCKLDWWRETTRTTSTKAVVTLQSLRNGAVFFFQIYTNHAQGFFCWVKIIIKKKKKKKM